MIKYRYLPIAELYTIILYSIPIEYFNIDIFYDFVCFMCLKMNKIFYLPNFIA